MNYPVFVNMNLVFLLAACANRLVDSVSYKYISCLWWLIWSKHVWGNWYLIIWLEITVQSSDSYFFKLTWGSYCLELYFWTVNFKNYPKSVILKKCQSLSKQSFKHNSVYSPSLNLTPNLFLKVYYTKRKRLNSLDSLYVFGRNSIEESPLSFLKWIASYNVLRQQEFSWHSFFDLLICSNFLE